MIEGALLTCSGEPITLEQLFASISTSEALISALTAT